MTGELRHGTEPGYYQHRVQAVPFPEDQGGEPCGCRRAHSEGEARRAANRPPRPPRPARARPKTKTCADCPTPISSKATRCRPCEAERMRQVRAAIAAVEPAPVRWVRDGLIWRAA